MEPGYFLVKFFGLGVGLIKFDGECPDLSGLGFNVHESIKSNGSDEYFILSDHFFEPSKMEISMWQNDEDVKAIRHSVFLSGSENFKKTINQLDSIATSDS